MRTTARREDFRIVHLSLQHDHVHLLVEANDQGGSRPEREESRG